MLRTGRYTRSDGFSFQVRTTSAGKQEVYVHGHHLPVLPLAASTFAVAVGDEQHVYAVRVADGALLREEGATTHVFVREPLLRTLRFEAAMTGGFLLHALRAGGWAEGPALIFLVCALRQQVAHDARMWRVFDHTMPAKSKMLLSGFDFRWLVSLLYWHCLDDLLAVALALYICTPCASVQDGALLVFAIEACRNKVHGMLHFSTTMLASLIDPRSDVPYYANYKLFKDRHDVPLCTFTHLVGIPSAHVCMFALLRRALSRIDLPPSALYAVPATWLSFWAVKVPRRAVALCSALMAVVACGCGAWLADSSTTNAELLLALACLYLFQNAGHWVAGVEGNMHLYTTARQRCFHEMFLVPAVVEVWLSLEFVGQ